MFPKRRNPLIANLFRRIEMVEAWGRGMPLILKYAPDVVIPQKSVTFLLSPSAVRPSLSRIDAGEAATQETTQETTQEKIIASLRAEPTLTRKLLAQRLDISEGGVKYHLKKPSRRRGRISACGSDQGGALGCD